MSNEIINQVPSVDRAKELEQQAKEGLNQLKQGQDKVILACHKMRDTKAYSALGFDSYYAWGESALNLKKSRLNELALAGEVQQELLIGVDSAEHDMELAPKVSEDVEGDIPSIDMSNVNEEKDDSSILTSVSNKPVSTVADLSEITTPQLVALAKAPKGERLAILDKVVVEAKEDDTAITTSVIKEAVKASAEPVENKEPSASEKAVAIRKQHKSVMGKVSKLCDDINELDTTQVDSEEIESWKEYLDHAKESISALEEQLGLDKN